MQTKNIKISKMNPSLSEKDNGKQDVVPIYSDLPTSIPHVERVIDFINFAKWYATPRAIRQLKTQKEFANKIGVSEDTLTDWKRNPYFWPLFQKFISEWIKSRIPDVINGLYKKSCGKGHAKDVLAFLKLGGISDDFNKKNSK